MDGSSPDSEKPKFKRRWMQFSLSTLFVLTLDRVLILVR